VIIGIGLENVDEQEEQEELFDENYESLFDDLIID